MHVAKFPQTLYNTGLKKRRVVGLVLLAALLALFLVFNRLPKLDTVEADLAAAASPKTECFQGFCFESDPDSSLLSRWWDFSLTYLRLVTVGMVFAFLVAGLTEVFLFPEAGFHGFATRGVRGSLKGLLVGPAMNLCSACIVPVATAFRRRGAGIEATLAIAQGSSTLNLPAMIMAAMVFTPLIGGSRIALSIVGAILIGPIVARLIRGDQQSLLPVSEEAHSHEEQEASSWGQVLTEGLPQWALASFRYLVRLGPIMVVAGFASGLAIQWISPDVVTTWLGDDLVGIGIAATLGVMINVPLLFEIPLVAALLLAGMGTAPAATLLFVAAAGGPITFWGLAKVMPTRAIVSFGTAIWVVGLIGGISVLAITTLTEDRDFGLRAAYASPKEADESGTAQVLLAPPPRSGTAADVAPFTDISQRSLDGEHMVWNARPGAAVFDFDRDGDMDFFVSNGFGHSNWLYRNEGDGTFLDVAEAAGVAAAGRNSTGVVACDVDNDGYQDLYVGAQGSLTDSLDFRSPIEERQNEDSLFLNNGDGTFEDITRTSFPGGGNLRSAMSMACADVDNDGLVDIYVGNLAENEFRPFHEGWQSGHYNVLYRNNGDLTFSDVAESAGVQGPQIQLRDRDGRPIVYKDRQTGEEFEGYRPNMRDLLGNRVGDPTGQTHAVLFFDHDSDGDLDLWVANDGDRLLVYRNDSSPGDPRFTGVSRELGIDAAGGWMGFAIGDYDGDADLDAFVTNMGYHPRLLPPPQAPRPHCAYYEQIGSGTCLHFLLRNDGAGPSTAFRDVAPSTVVTPSGLLPPDSLDPSVVHPPYGVPTGLSAYDFGFGATFFDLENDGDQDLYWLGSIERGEAPGGQFFPAAGRMLRGDGSGSFEDVTVEARLLGIQRVLYDRIDPEDPARDSEIHRAHTRYHENGKGVAHGDLNSDGYVDLIGTHASGAFHREGQVGNVVQAPGPVFVWVNGHRGSHWITLRLRGRMAVDGTGSNADAIGARVYVTTDAGGRSEPLVQVQEVRAGSSYLSMDSVELEFGLGDVDIVGEIRILWPSGRTQTIENVGADRMLLITEPKS